MLLLTGPRDSVIGRYAIEPDGETTLSSYGVDRILAGKPVFWRELNAGRGTPTAMPSLELGTILTAVIVTPFERTGALTRRRSSR